MPSAKEEAARLNWLLAEGKIPADEPCKVVLPRLEARKRVKNEPDEEGKQKTRFIWNTDFPDGYSELNAGKDRLMQKIVNKQVAISIAAKLWLGTPDIVLAALSDDRPLTLGEISVLLDSDWLYDLLPGNGTDDFILQKVREALKDVG